jgi:uncharacterized protein (DUF952 family)
MIYHITRRDDWPAAQREGVYRSDSLESQGFIHASTAGQVTQVANVIFKGQTDLVLLCIDESKVRSKVIYEPPINPSTGQPEPNVTDLFPHIYGPLNLDAVVRVVDFPPGSDGTFHLPFEAVNTL